MSQNVNLDDTKKDFAAGRLFLIPLKHFLKPQKPF